MGVLLCLSKDFRVWLDWKVAPMLYLAKAFLIDDAKLLSSYEKDANKLWSMGFGSCCCLVFLGGSRYIIYN